MLACSKRGKLLRWFGEQEKSHMRFLPTSKEDEITNIKCVVVFFEILKNTGLISIKYTQIQSGVDGKVREKCMVYLVEGNKHKWLHLIGEGFTYVRLKSFVNTMDNSLYSLEDDYEMLSVMSEAL